jgi:hypothetical protein
VQYNLLERPILLSENIEADGHVYEFLLNNHCDLHECSRLAFELQHGGGADLPSVFEALIHDGRIVCTISDTDKNCPAAINSKLAQLTRIRENSGWPLCFAVSPPCREVENLVPLELVMALPSGKRNPTNAIQLTIRQQEANQGHPRNEQYWHFFDLKEGLLTAKFARLDAMEKSLVRNRLQLARVDPESQNVVGYGDRVIRQIFGENQYMSELRKLTRDGSWRDVFCSFIEEFIWVFLSTTKVVT